MLLHSFTCFLSSHTHLLIISLTYLGVTRLASSQKSSLAMSFDSKYFKKDAASMADTTEFVVKGLLIHLIHFYI